MLLPNLSCPQFSITAYVLCVFSTNKDDDDDDDEIPGVLQWRTPVVQSMHVRAQLTCDASPLCTCSTYVG